MGESEDINFEAFRNAPQNFKAALSLIRSKIRRPKINILLGVDYDDVTPRAQEADQYGLLTAVRAPGQLKIATLSDTADISTNANVEVRPAEGFEWDLEFLSGGHDGAQPKTVDLRITDDTIDVYVLPQNTLAGADSGARFPLYPTAYDEVGLGSCCPTGVKPMILTNDIYLIVHFDGIGNGKIGTVELQYRERSVPY